MAEYAYVRVSASDQNINRQIDAMVKESIPVDNIYIDYRSGKNFERPMYRKLLKKLRAGDVLYIKSIDRLGRNYAEILEQWRNLTATKKVCMRVLDMPLLNTVETCDSITDMFIADLVLQILSYVAQVERENIRARQAEGIAAAKRRGVKFGRKRLPIPDDFYHLRDEYKQGKISARKAALELHTSHNTFIKWVKNTSA